MQAQIIITDRPDYYLFYQTVGLAQITFFILPNPAYQTSPKRKQKLIKKV